MTGTELRELRARHSMMMEARDELSYQIRDIEAEIEHAETQLIPRGVDIETAVRGAIQERWPGLNVKLSVLNVYDSFIVSIGG